MVETTKMKKIQLEGMTGKLIDHVIANWLLNVRETNPAILEIFADRDKLPYRDLLPWSGEFAGKYSTGAYYVYRITKNQDLYRSILSFLEEWISYQAEDGYLGCYQKECRLTGAFSQNPEQSGATWDAWSHYHAMYGLLLWYEETKNETYFNAVLKIADLFMNTFYNGKKHLISIGWSEMNLAPYHIFAKLYNLTKEKRYLDFAKEIEADLSDEAAGNYINHSLNGLEYYQCPKPRWESMHIIMGFAEMYRATNDTLYLQVIKQIFYSILKTDVHNTGAFSTDEAAIGTPFKEGAIETCCVVAYNALAVEIMKLTNDPIVADFLELTLYNAVMGCFSPSGHWSTYHTPMEGVRTANFHHINFQCRPGSPELNCCSVNAPRGVGMLAEWAVMEDGDTIYLNYFEPFTAITENGLSIQVKGNYPAQGNVQIRLQSDAVQRIGIRVPAWSKQTFLTVNGKTIAVEAGSYAYCEQIWDDTISIQFDFSVHFLYGEEKYAGKRSIYYGSILYGCDVSSNGNCFMNLPTIPVQELENATPSFDKNGKIVLSLPCGIVLTDFYHLGCTGSEYKTWFAIGE